MMDLVIITGMSGAGKSQAVKALEDLGYYCVDNLPPVLIGQFMSLCEENVEDIRRMALVTDIRGGVFFKKLMDEIERLQYRNIQYKLLFLDASDEVLVKRFKEARRAHPVAPNGSIEDAINEERIVLQPLREKADYIVDTSSFTQGQFKKQICILFGSKDKESALSISVMSFGFKKGIPKDADFVFDVRFLPNPYYIENLRALTGNNTEVQDYVMSFEESKKMYQLIADTLDFVIPQCREEGRTHLSIAIGCTGGKHRSVTLANKIGLYLEKQSYFVNMIHRDVGE